MRLTSVIKGMVFGSALALTLASTAKAESVAAPGKVFYVSNNGELVKRELTLTVPARGEGEVTLGNDNWSASSSRFFTAKYHGRTVFYVVFNDVGPNHKQMLLRGSYIRGTNLAAYWGDVYFGHCPEGQSVQSCANTQDHQQDHQDDHKHGGQHWDHVGGFAFKAPVTGGQAPIEGAQQSQDAAAIFGE